MFLLDPNSNASHQSKKQIIQNYVNEGLHKLEIKSYQEAFESFCHALQYYLIGNLNETNYLFDILDYIAESVVLINIQTKDRSIFYAMSNIFKNLPESNILLAEINMKTLSKVRYLQENKGLFFDVDTMIDLASKTVTIYERYDRDLRYLIAKFRLGQFVFQKAPWEGFEIMEQTASLLEEATRANKSEVTRKVYVQYLTGFYVTLANNYFNVGFLDDSVRYYRNALSVYEEENEFHGLVSTRISLGNIELQKRDFEKAVDEFGKANSIAYQIKDWQSIVQIHKGLSHAYSLIGQYSKANNELQLCEKALRYIDDGAGVFSILIDIARTYEKQSDYGKAKEVYINAEHMAKRLQNPEYILHCSIKLGILCYETHDWASAKQYFQDGLSIAKQNNKLDSIKLIDSYLNFIS
jgi:tetratricopeptide (TPR) repeat protein